MEEEARGTSGSRNHGTRGGISLQQDQGCGPPFTHSHIRLHTESVPTQGIWRKENDQGSQGTWLPEDEHGSRVVRQRRCYVEPKSGGREKEPHGKDGHPIMLTCARARQIASVISDALRPHGPSVGFSREEYWSGLLCPPPGDLPDSGIKPESPLSPALAGGRFITSATWEAQMFT